MPFFLLSRTVRQVTRRKFLYQNKVEEKHRNKNIQKLHINESKKRLRKKVQVDPFVIEEASRSESKIICQKARKLNAKNTKKGRNKKVKKA